MDPGLLTGLRVDKAFKSSNLPVSGLQCLSHGSDTVKKQEVVMPDLTPSTVLPIIHGSTLGSLG